jgi:trans-aconitate 2-methyltransferase
MQRIIEPELMVDSAQAVAYASADFSESDVRFVNRFVELFGGQLEGTVFDLGCGPGNITFRMAKAFPACNVIGVEGATAMLDIARQRAVLEDLPPSRVCFREIAIPSEKLDRNSATAVVSNSLLHHLHDPSVLWHTVLQISQAGAPILVADLRRPETAEEAHRIVDTYAKDAAEILQMDYYNSLLAAFEVEEVIEQLQSAGLNGLGVKAVGDRYLEVYGRFKR